MRPAVRRVTGAVAVLGTLVAAPLVTSSAEGSSITGGTVSVSRSAGIPGEELVVRVSALPGPAARAVSLQRCVGYAAGSTTACTYWVNVTGSTGRTTVDHAYTFHTRVHAMDYNGYRAVAPATGSSPQVITPARTVRGVQQEATITVPATATAGSTVEVTMAWWVYVDRTNRQPGRAGRALALEQRNSDGSWTRLRTVTTPSSGSVTVPLTLPSAGARTFRTVATTWQPASQDTQVGWFPSYPSTVVVS